MLLLLSQVRAGPAPAPEEPEAFDYYIGPSGSDSNDGLTTGTPWAITALTDKTSLIAGKRVGLLSGTYTVPRSYTDNWGGNTSHYGIRVSAAGTEGSPTIIESVTPRGAVLQPDTDVTTGLVTVEAQYVQLKNIVLNAQTMTALWARGDYCLYEGLDFGAVSVNSGGDNFGAVYFKARDETKVQSPVFRNCLFRGVYNLGGTSYGWNSAAFFGFSVKDIVIEYCTFDNVYNPFRTKYDWQGFTFRYNFLRTNVRSALGSLTDPSEFPNETPKYHNNVCVYWGVNSDNTSNGEAEDEIFSNVEIYNNTFVRPGGSALDGMLRWNLTTDTQRQAKFYNNICHATSAVSGSHFMHALIRWEGTASHFGTNFTLMDYNAYPNNAAGYFTSRISDTDFYTSVTSYTSLATWRTASSYEANSILAAPLINDDSGVTSEDYQLDVSSPCRNAGRVGGTSGGAAIDMGAWTSGVTQIGCDF